MKIKVASLFCLLSLCLILVGCSVQEMTETPEETLVRKLHEAQEDEMRKLAGIAVGRLRAEILMVQNIGSIDEQAISRLETRANIISNVLSVFRSNSPSQGNWSYESVLEETTALLGETVNLRMATESAEVKRAAFDEMVREILARRTEVLAMAPQGLLDLDTFLKERNLTLEQALAQRGISSLVKSPS